MKRGKPAKSAKAKDFQTKRHKVGKGKRAPENATAISFKTRAVVVPAQLEETHEPTTKKKLPLQTLMNQLKHYRTSVRLDALMGLREIFQEHPALLLPNLTKIVDHVLVVLVDQEAGVRHGLFVLLKLVFSSITQEQLQPFFPVLVAHLTCGFTHIDDRVQLDSLKIFDLVLTCFPRLLTPYAHEFLPLLVGMIARQETLYSTSKKVDHETIALTSNPNSKLSRQTFRLEIFTQLCKFLQILLETLEVSNGSVGPISSHTQAPIVDLQNKEVLVSRGRTFEPTHSAFCDLSSTIPHVAVIQTHGIMISENTFLIGPDSSGSPHRSHSGIFPDRNKFVEFAQNLISLLLECWVECSPVKLIHGGSLKQDTLSVMETILNLLSLLLKLIFRVDQVPSASLQTGSQKEQKLTAILCKRFHTEFQRLFMAYFPFSNFQLPSKQFCTMNFTVSQIMLLLVCTTSCQENSTLIQKTVSAVCDFYGNLEEDMKSVAATSQTLTSCVKITVDILPHLFTSLHQVSDDSQRKLFAGVWSVYSVCHPQSSAKQMLIQCFCDLHTQLFREDMHISSRSLLQSELLLPWQQTLFDLLAQLGDSNPEASTLVVESITLSAMRRETSCLQGLQENINSVLGPGSIVPRLPPPTQRRVFELLWHLPQLETPVFSQLTQSIHSGRYDIHLMTYLIQIIHHSLVLKTVENFLLALVNALTHCPHSIPLGVHWLRLTMTAQPPETTLAHYLGFMFTLLVGYTQEELKSMESQPSPESSCVSAELVKPVGPVRVEYHVKIVEVVCGCLLATDFSSQVLEMLEPAIQMLMGKLQKLPVNVATGILKLGCCLSPECGVPEKLVLVFGHLCFSCLVAMETNSNSSLDVTFTELTNQMLILSQPVTQAVIYKFQESATGVQLLAKTFISFLNNPVINATLRECREDICTTTTAILDRSHLVEEHCWWKQQLELAVVKFRIAH